MWRADILRRMRAWVVIAVWAGLAAPAAAAPRPFGHDCVPHAGTRRCATTSLDQRVPSWDGIPLDVDVTLPATGNGPFPTIALLHGFLGDKTDLETDDPNGGNRFNDVWYAKHGYATMALSFRGFGDSCGTVSSRTPDCAKGWFHMGDQRYEVRDVQYLLGKLVDEGIADPKALGSAGCSYGSLMTIQLAMLRNRVRLPDGTLAPWRSPKGVPLSLAAGYGQCSISSLVALVGPNGRFLDYRTPGVRQDSNPPGIIKSSFAAGSLAGLPAVGYAAPPLVDPSADFTSWETYGLTESAFSDDDVRVAKEFDAFHEGIAVPMRHTTPAPLDIENGWADDVTPPETGGLRLYRVLRHRDPHARISLQLADYGHQRSKEKPADLLAIATRATRFFDAYLRGKGKPPRPGSVVAYTQTCPVAAPSAGPFHARDWRRLHPGEVRFGTAAARTITANSGDATTDAQVDPIVATPCAELPVTTASGTAVYTYKVHTPFTVLGLPTIDFDLKTTGPYGQLLAHLWDLGPDGKQTLVTRGAYRLTGGQHGHVTWQLFGGGWRYQPGHTVRLEIQGGDSPFAKAAEQSFTATLSHVRIALPTHERPDGGAIRRPLRRR